MTTNKKLVVTVGVMAVALILALTGIIVVLVTANQRASSAVNVKYTASDVAVTLSATAYLGSNSYVFTKGGVVDGETELVLSPTVTEGSLSQTSDIASFDLTKTNTYVVFEYVFANNTDTIDVKIDQDGVPATKENINLTYTYSDTQITNFATLEDNAEFTAQLLPAYTGEETVKYVYIKAQIADLLYDSSLVGDFGWALSKPQDSEVNTVTLSVADADYVERECTGLESYDVTSDYTHKTLDTSIDTNNINLYPAVTDKAFVGWSETEGGSVISTIDMSNDESHNALRGVTTTTLYPVYKGGTVPAVNFSYNANGYYSVVNTISTTATEFVFPDLYDDGTNGVAKVTTVDMVASYVGVLSGNTTVITAHYGRYYKDTGTFAMLSTNIQTLYLHGKDTSLGVYSFASSSISSINVLGGMSTIGRYSLSSCTQLTTLEIHNSVVKIDQFAFAYCTKLTSITIPEGLVEISDNAFESCGLTGITIPSSVTKIGFMAFGNCSGLLYENGGTGIVFEDTTTWEKAPDYKFNSDISVIDVTNSSQNAIWFVNTNGYKNYIWRKV